jgi:hypothetical protein
MITYVRTCETVFACIVSARVFLGAHISKLVVVLLGAHIGKLLDASDVDHWHTVFCIRAHELLETT